MRKVYIVMDEPDSCDECPLFDDEYLQMECKGNGYGIGFPYPKDFKQEWCPLRTIPTELPCSLLSCYHDDFNDGWNACIDRILEG